LPEIASKRIEMHIIFTEKWLTRNAHTTLMAKAEPLITRWIELLMLNRSFVIIAQSAQLEKSFQEVRRRQSLSINLGAHPKSENAPFETLLQTVIQRGLRGNCDEIVERVSLELFLYQKTLYSLFTDHDLVAAKWPKMGAGQAKSSPLMSHYSDFSDRICYFFMSQILRRESPESSGIVMRFVAKLAMSCKLKGDLVSMMSLFSALYSQTPIVRLAKAWELLHKSSAAGSIRTALMELCDAGDKFAALRDYCLRLSEKELFHIPFFAGCLGEIAALEERVSPILETESSYNIAKMRQVMAKIVAALAPQRWPVAFEVPKSYTTDLIPLLSNHVHNEKELYKLSEQLEPRTKIN
jgi:hypothetical protein